MKTKGKTTVKKGAAAKPLSTIVKQTKKNMEKAFNKSSRQELKAIQGGCEEASPASRDHYIPCNKPAKKMIYSKRDKKTYRMCEACADHSVKNRGMIDKGSYDIKSEWKKPSHKDEGKTPVLKAPSILDKSFRKGVAGKTKADTDDFEKEEASGDQLANITKEAMKAVALDKQINDLNAAVALLVADRDTILNKSLPSLLDSANMEGFDLKDGSSIEIKDVVAGSLPSAATKPKEREKALGWLLKNGGKGLIKTTFKSEFGTGQEALVAAFEKLITKAKFSAKKEIGVHPQTLCAFVRELLEDGKKVPIETLGIYVGRHARIKLSEEAQKKAEAERVKPKRNK